MTTRTFTDVADLVASLTTPPIGAWWHDNPANDAPPEWAIQTATCADFDRLAKLLPTSPSKKWLNGDQRHSMTGPTTRTHAVEGNGWIRHVCHGCPDALIDLPDQTCETCSLEHPGTDCREPDLFGGAAC